MATCTKCGREFCEDELVEIEGELVCEDCAEAMGYAKCRDCGEWFKADECYEYNDEPLCESCYANDYFTCEDCGQVFPNDEAYEVNDRHGYSAFVCEDCRDENYRCCMDCGEWFAPNCGSTDENGDFLCDHCYEYHDWYTCPDCGCFTHEVGEGDDGDYYCPYCINDHLGNSFTTHLDDPGSRDDGSAIHGYSFKPRAVIGTRRNDPDEKFTMGVEDETDSPDYSMAEKAVPTAEAIKALTDRVYMKRDGSLNTGFEIVSHPATLAYHMYEMPWRGICSKALKAGFRSHDTETCGLHIHVGRAGLGDSEDEINRTIRKVVILVNRYWTELSRFTRRTEDRLNQWGPRNYVDGYYPDTVITDSWAERRIPIANNHENRYHAINCENEATIEFRIFRGTLKRDTLIASLQLVWNICHYAMAHDWDEIQHGTWLDVARFKRWNELDAYLTVRGLAPAVQPVQNSTHTPNFGGADGIRGDE